MEDFILTQWKLKLGQGNIFINDLSNTVICTMPGRFGLIKVVDLHRTTAKRKTDLKGVVKNSDFITTRPINSNSFNFTKIKPSEFISISNGHAILVNVSPMAYGHILFCPYFQEAVFSQILTEPTILAALQFHSCFTRPDFRLCFNSLGGWASVNHHHWHGLFLADPAFTVSATGKFPIETCPITNMLTVADCSIALVQGHVNCLRLSRVADDTKTANVVFKLVHALLTRDVPHNVMVSRDFVYLTPRQPQKVGLFPYSEADGGLHVAVAEVSGYMICLDNSTYNLLAENDVFTLCQEHVSFNSEYLIDLVSNNI